MNNQFFKLFSNMPNVITLRKIYLHWGIVFISITMLAGCVGSPVESYKTKSQKFSWGYMHAWMSSKQRATTADTEGLGYLLLNFSFNKSVMKRGCTLTVNRVYLKDAKTGTVLIDEVPTLANDAPMIEDIGDYNTGQLSLSKYPFKYVQSSFPYDLNVDMVFDCNNQKTPLIFSKPIEFSMVQPVIWQQ